MSDKCKHSPWHYEPSCHDCEAWSERAQGLFAASAGSGDVVHGFTLGLLQDASSLRWWPEFVEFFERVEGAAPHPRDSDHKRLFEYFVQGAFRQWENQNDLTRDNEEN